MLHKPGRTVFAGCICIAGLGQQIKTSDGGEALLRALDDVIQLGVDKVRDAVPRSLQSHEMGLFLKSTRMDSVTYLRAC